MDFVFIDDPCDDRPLTDKERELILSWYDATFGGNIGAGLAPRVFPVSEAFMEWLMSEDFLDTEPPRA